MSVWECSCSGVHSPLEQVTRPSVPDKLRLCLSLFLQANVLHPGCVAGWPGELLDLLSQQGGLRKLLHSDNGSGSMDENGLLEDVPSFTSRGCHPLPPSFTSLGESAHIRPPGVSSGGARSVWAGCPGHIHWGRSTPPLASVLSQ